MVVVVEVRVQMKLLITPVKPHKEIPVGELDTEITVAKVLVAKQVAVEEQTQLVQMPMVVQEMAEQVSYFPPLWLTELTQATLRQPDQMEATLVAAVVVALIILKVLPVMVVLVVVQMEHTMQPR